MSGIYIQNVELPKYGERISILFGGYAYYEDMVNPFRELEPIYVIRDHRRLIDADTLKEKLDCICDRYDAGIIDNLTCMNQLLAAVNETPTIIPESRDKTDGN